MKRKLVYSQVNAVYENGVLNPLEPLDLPEGVQVQLTVQLTTTNIGVSSSKLVYPTRFIPATKLDSLTGLLAIGGDALADSETLYDSDKP